MDPIEQIKQCRIEVDKILVKLEDKIDNKHLSTEQIQHIADMAAEKAAILVIDRAYGIIGKSVLTSVFKYVGIFVFALAVLTHDKWSIFK